MGKQADLPNWATELAEKYRGGTLWEFILHGNVHDLVPYRSGSKVEFYSLRQYLEQVLFARRDAVIYYDQASGIQISDTAQMQGFLNVVQAIDTVSGTKFSSQGLPRDPRRALYLIERYLRSGLLNKKRSRRVALVIDFAQMVAPAQAVSGLSAEEASTVITLLKWAQDPMFQKADITICLLCENLSELNDLLVKSPHTAKLRIPLPSEEQRSEYVTNALVNDDFIRLSDVQPAALARLTAGLSRLNLLHLVSQAIKNDNRLTMKYVRSAKKELIEKECYGLLEFIEPKHGLDVVVGHEAAKEWLQSDAKLIKETKIDALPMGYLICGPVGTGKTFLATCFTGQIGVPCVKLMNFRSQWQGVTEGNWEKILTVLKAMGPVGVIIDEADAAVGDRSSSGDSGTSSRVFAKLASTMGDTANRGHILWFLLTCRPDLLPVDLKRQGRAEVHIPLFYPAKKERMQMFKVMGKKTKTKLADNALTEAISKKELSGADIEAVIVRAKRHAYLDGRDTVEAADLNAVIKNFVPPVRGEEIELQELAAVVECSDKAFLSTKYKRKRRTTLQKRLGILKQLVD